MARPLLSVIVPTIGRLSLRKTLRSLRLQAPPEQVEIVVVGDTHAQTWAQALQPVPAWCEEFEARYLAYDGGEHCVGHPQREAGAAVARGKWLWWLQDDDIATQDAVASITAALDGPPGPRLFRARSGCAGYVVWQRPVLALGNIDADCIVTPNLRRRLGCWARRYAGDFDMIQETVALWGGKMQWCEALIALGRPRPREVWMPEQAT